jgi:hypothetical protein
MRLVTLIILSPGGKLDLQAGYESHVSLASFVDAGGKGVIGESA